MKKIFAFVLAFLPVGAFAQTRIGNINEVATRATGIGNLIIELAIAVAVIWIIISVIRYLVAGGGEKAKEGGMAILWGVVALFVILSIWGLVAILRNSFATNDQIPRDQIDRIKIPAPAPLP